MTEASQAVRWCGARYRAVVWSSLVVLVVAGAVVRLLVGQRMGWPEGDALGAVWRLFAGGWLAEAGVYSTLDIRLLRVALAVVVGASLSVSGVALQALLRNVLAEPFVLGLSSGAAMGVMAQVALSYGLGRAFGPGYVGALAGAWVTMGVVYMAGRWRGMIDPIGLLLVGVVLNTINGAVIMILNQLAGPGGSTRTCRVG